MTIMSSRRYWRSSTNSGATPVKWHVEYGGRFGFEDFVDPTFIGAKTLSLLERLKAAKQSSSTGSRFAFITTYRAKDGDQLAELISGHDKSLLLEKLFDGTTDKSRMGHVRKLWREHLALANDNELRCVLTWLRIVEGHRSLDEVREQINLGAQVVGLIAYSDESSDFRYDELDRQLKVRGLNSLTRANLEQFCRDEGLFAPRHLSEDSFLDIAVRSFLGAAADICGSSHKCMHDLARSRSSTPGEEAADVLVAGIQRGSRLSLSRRPPARPRSWWGAYSAAAS